MHKNALQKGYNMGIVPGFLTKDQNEALHRIRVSLALLLSID